MRGGADALRRGVERAGIGLGEGDELAHRLHVLQLRRVGQDRVRHLAHHRDRDELRADRRRAWDRGSG